MWQQTQTAVTRSSSSLRLSTTTVHDNISVQQVFPAVISAWENVSSPGTRAEYLLISWFYILQPCSWLHVSHFYVFYFPFLSHITAAESHTVFISFFHSKKQFHLLVLNRYFVWQRKLWHILSTPNIDNLHVFPLFHSNLLASLFISDTGVF